MVEVSCSGIDDILSVIFIEDSGIRGGVGINVGEV